MPAEQPYPYGAARIGAVLKSCPEDFEVEEALGFEPEGTGEHLFVWVEKRGLTTSELIERLARDHQLEAKHIGYSGLKDKHALTRQWLSLHLPGKPDPFDHPCGEGYRVLRQTRHLKKLRPDIEIVDIKDRLVYCRFIGACSTCAGSDRTLKLLVEQALKDQIDERVRVIAV